MDSETRHGDTGDDRVPDIEVDARGLACPLPVIELARAVRGAAIGARIRVLATDEAAAVDIPVWCRMQHQSLAGRSAADDGALVFDVDKVRDA
jgi:TusA-related sulfurtransferase